MGNRGTLWGFLILTALAAQAAEPPALPDLDVTFIERTPRYVPGPWVYPGTGPQFLGVSNTVFTKDDLRGAHKQWPDEGEAVTFTAHVANKSATPSPACPFAWFLDGKEAGSGTLPAIEPWKETTQKLPWKWQAGAHTVRFTVDAGNAVKEICEKNNSLEDRTDALTLQMRVTPQLYEAFHTKPNGMGSFSFEDWVQRHVKIMNGVLAGSVYPATAPQGILERVRVDDVKVMSREDIVKSENYPQRSGFDGGWNYYDDAFGKPNGWFEFHIKDDFVARVDTGLLHELTHQLGIIDEYCIVVSPHWNHVRDEEGDPVVIGYNTKQPGMMGGGGPAVDFDGTVMPALNFTPDADGNVTVGPQGTFAAYSEETAGALNALRGMRRGHFGLYLFDLPAQSFVQILDNTGKPAEGVSVTVYQQSPYPGPQSIPDRPACGGGTDKNGVYPLGGMPFGNINCIGLNGTLFLVIRGRGHTEYRCLDVANFNIAKWRGHKEAWTAVFQTGIPPVGAPAAPQGLRWGSLRPNTPALLRWEPSKSPEVKSYNVYRQRTYGKDDRSTGLSVSFESPYVKVASVPANQTSCEAKPLPGYAGANETPWFTVTAVDAQGRESGQAKNKELVCWGPWGNAKVERSDPQIVSVTLSPGASSIQVRNSFVAGKNARLKFQFQVEGERHATLRFAVAGIGQLDYLLDTDPEPKPGTLPVRKAGDGWLAVDVSLRELFDKAAANKKVSPAQARTTWNDDWLVTECQFGDWTPTARGEATFRFRNPRIVEER